MNMIRMDLEELRSRMMAIGATKPDRRSFDHEERENRRFLSHHANLTHALKKLSRLARSGQPIPSETLTEALKPAVASAAGIDRRLRKRIRPAIYNERCPPQARHLAQKVFDIPELLEMIILSLRFKDKLKVQRLNKQWHAAVNNSINVQRSLSLRPDTSSGFFRAPFADPGVLRGLHAGFRFYTEGPYGRPQTIESDWILFEVQLGGYSYPSPHRVGDRIRAMLICQPPVFSLECFSCCCSPHFGAPDRQLGLVKNPAGLTIGDIFDTTAKLLHQHKNCPNASVYQHDRTTGEVKNHIAFRGLIKLHHDDPILKVKSRKEAERLEKERLTTTQHQLMDQFHQAKTAAAANGNPIPSFQEWKATLASTNAH